MGGNYRQRRGKVSPVGLSIEESLLYNLWRELERRMRLGGWGWAGVRSLGRGGQRGWWEPGDMSVPGRQWSDVAGMSDTTGVFDR